MTRHAYGAHRFQYWRGIRYVSRIAGGKYHELAGPCARDASRYRGIHDARAPTLQDLALVAHRLRPNCRHDQPQLSLHQSRHSGDESG